MFFEKDIELLPYRAILGGSKNIIGWEGGFTNHFEHAKFGLKRPNSLFGEINHHSIFTTIDVLEECFYGGVIFPYYGHFLLESLARLRKNTLSNAQPVVFHCLGRMGILEWQKQIFDLLDVRPNIIVINENAYRFKRLFSAQQDNHINCNISEVFINWLSSQSAVKAIKPIPTEKLYLSRSFIKNAHAAREAELETLLSRAGYTIIHPEKLTIIDQIAYLKGAKRIMAIEGSALHTLIFCSNEIELELIPRRESLPHNFSLQFSLQESITLKTIHAVKYLANDFKEGIELDLRHMQEYLKNN